MAKTETELQLEANIQKELEKYLKAAKSNKAQTDFYVYLTIMVNAITALISFGVFTSVPEANRGQIIGVIAIGMAAINSFWAYYNPGSQYAQSITAYHKIQTVYDEYLFGDNNGSEQKSLEERKQKLLRSIHSIRNEFTETKIRKTIDAIDQIVKTNGK